MDKRRFRHINDVDNEIEITNEGIFLGIRLTSSNNYTQAITVKKEVIKELHKWLGKYLGE